MKKIAFHERAGYKWWVLLTVSIGSLTVALDNSIIATGLPILANVFKTDSSVIAWVNIVYFMTSQSLMLTLGKIGDAKGHKRVFMAGLAFYTLGLIACALAQSVGQLIASRAFQGVGAATGYSLSMAIAVAVFPENERGKALGILMAVNSIGLVAGPVIGGFIIDFLGWRAVFYTRAPFALGALLMAWLIIKEQKITGQRFILDIKGSVGLLCFLSSFLLFLCFSGKQGITWPVLLMAGLAVIFFIFFLHSEKNAEQPIIKLSLFKNRIFTIGTVCAVLQTAAGSTIIFLIPFYLTDGLGSTSSIVGLYMALIAVPMLVLSPISGRLSDKMGSKFLATFGMFVTTVALILLSRLGANPTYFAIGIAIFLAGSGMSIFLPPNNSAVMGAVPRDMLGTASAVVTAARQVGASSGIAVTGAIYSTLQIKNLDKFLNDGFDLLAAKKLASVAGFQYTIMAGVVICAIGIVISLTRGPRK
ncbi:MAG: MFS transporter [Spirochaetes bacterium]|nr:MFS transporter [Spirochaetota bacterium]